MSAGSLKPAASERLRKRLDGMKSRLPEDTYVRLYRSLSWLKAAEGAAEGKDAEWRFMTLWISFNALYGGSDFIVSSSGDDKKKASEKQMFKRFLGDLIGQNKSGLLRALLPAYEKFRSHLIDNKYVYYGFWIDQFTARETEKYSRHFNDDREKARRAFSDRNLGVLLALVFERLYVLRNQVFHGAATYKGRVNRPQLDTAVLVMELLVPEMLRTVLDMLRNEPEYGRWGRLPYPPLDLKRLDSGAD